MRIYNFTTKQWEDEEDANPKYKGSNWAGEKYSPTPPAQKPLLPTEFHKLETAQQKPVGTGLLGPVPQKPVWNSAIKSMQPKRVTPQEQYQQQKQAREAPWKISTDGLLLKNAPAAKSVPLPAKPAVQGLPTKFRTGNSADLRLQNAGVIGYLPTRVGQPAPTDAALRRRAAYQYQQGSQGRIAELEKTTTFHDLLTKQGKLSADEKLLAKKIIQEREKIYNARVRDAALHLKAVSEDDQAFSMETTALKNRVSGGTAATMGFLNSASGFRSLDKASLKQNEAAAKLAAQINAPAVNAAARIAQAHGGKSAVQLAAEQNPVAYGAGSFVGESFKYMVLSPFVRGIPGVDKLAKGTGSAVAKMTGGKISAAVAERLTLGRIADLPLDVINAALDTDNVEDFAKNLGIYQATGLAADIGFEGLTFSWHKIREAARNGRLQRIMDPDAIRQADVDAYLRDYHAGDAPKSQALTQEPAARNVSLPTRKEAGRMKLTDPFNLARYRIEIDNSFSGVLPSGSDIVVGRTPDILVQFGAPDKALHLSQSTARKIVYPTGYLGLEHGHNLGMSVLKNLPSQLEDPIAILKNPQPNAKGLDSLVVLTEWYDQNGLRIVSPVHLNAKGAIDVQNNIASTFGADYMDRLLGKNGENIIYTKNNEDIRKLLSTGVESPKAMADDIFADTSIPQQPSKINGQNGGNSGGDFGRLPPEDPFRQAAEQAQARAGEMDPFLRDTLEIRERVKNTPGLPVNPDGTDAFGRSVFGENAVGAAQANPRSYDHMKNAYGTIPPGEAPRAREVDVPISTNGEDKVSQFTRTLMEAPATPKEMVGRIEDLTAEGVFSHEVLTDKYALQNAVDTVSLKGYQGAYDQWQDVTKGRRPASKEDIAVGHLLYAQAAAAGDGELAGQLAAELAVEATRSAQTLQAVRMLKKTTPQGQAYYLQRAADILTKEMEPRLGGRKITPDAELVKKLLNTADQAERENIIKLIQRDIAGQVPQNWWDKFDAWRYTAMLANPRTHIKNVLGNAVFVPARKIKDILGWGLERGNLLLPTKFGREDMTKGFLNPLAQKDRALLSFAKDDYKIMKDVISGEGKYNDIGKILREGRKGLGEANGKLLDLEDSWFSAPAYMDSLSQAAKARGYSAEFLQSGTREANRALNNIREVAVLEAQKATYRDASKLADGLNKLKNTNRVAKVVGGGIIPFTKTPINVVKRGLEYSPAGFLKTLALGGQQIKTGQKTAAQVIDDLASGLTGTGIGILGWWLAKEGIITANAGEGKEGDFAELQGRQNYSLNIGGKSFTIDWMAPTVLPAMVGAEVFRLQDQNGKGDVPDTADMLEAAANVVEPVFDLTMLDGINSTIRAAGYSDNPASGVVGNALLSYAGQAVPSVLGAVNRTFFDPVRRSTTVTDKTGFMRAAQQQVNRAAAKVPWLSKKLPAMTDAWGRESEVKGLPLRFAENFVLPGYINTLNTTDADSVVGAVYDESGNASVLPKSAQRKFKVEGEDIVLAPHEYAKANMIRGQAANEAIGALQNNAVFSDMSKKQRSDVIQDIYSYASALGKMAVSGYVPDDWVEKAMEAGKNGIPLEDYVLCKNVLTPLKHNVEKNTALLNMEGDSDTKEKLYKYFVSDSEGSRKKIDAFKGVGLDMDDFLTASVEYANIDDGGGTAQEKATRFYHWLDTQGLNKQQYEAVASIMPYFQMFPAKPQAYRVDMMSASGQKKWAKAKAWGLSERQYATYYKIATQQKKKAEIMADLQKAGMTQQQAAYFWGIIKSK